MDFAAEMHTIAEQVQSEIIQTQQREANLTRQRAYELTPTRKEDAKNQVRNAAQSGEYSCSYEVGEYQHYRLDRNHMNFVHHLQKFLIDELLLEGLQIKGRIMTHHPSGLDCRTDAYTEVFIDISW
jgi:hypothetical protein